MRTSSVSPTLSPLLRRSLALTILLTSAHCSDGNDSTRGSNTRTRHAAADTAIDLDAKPQDGGSCDSEDAVDRYQACYGESERCLELNSNCSGYTEDKAKSFCAKLCGSDEDCPTLDGFEAACNFAWCALLCDDAECPDGMECVQDVDFIDRDGNSRGPRDVCVIAL